MSRIGITMGDPAGIGLEIILKACHKIGPSNHDWVIYGSKKMLDHSSHLSCPDWIDWVDPRPDLSPEICAQPSAINGQLSMAYLDAAVQDATAQRLDAVVTAPINKTSWSLAEIPYTGHTTYLQDVTSSDVVRMAFYSPKLCVILDSIHIPLSTVPTRLNNQHLKNTIQCGQNFLRSLGKPNGHIAIAGLNPHAGENGLFGTEEAEIIEPVIKSLNSSTITGPHPPDTVFKQALDGDFDLVVALYHDQGLIPFKTVAFDTGVNVSVGLPFVRTSPDHGTAFDIAHQNSADHRSMLASIECAIMMSQSHV